jgi:two-component system, chemotaxis family, protein-glutamate methylesterase/glutaminase
MSDKHDSGRPVALTCPDCGGSARPDMDAGQFERMEHALAVALRSLNERVELCQRMAETSKANGQTYSMERWEEARREAEDRARVLRRFLERDWIAPGTLESAL